MNATGIPRRELVTLLAYLETGSHAMAAHRLGISESTARQRMSQLIRRLEVRNAAQAVWLLRDELGPDVRIPLCARHAEPWFGHHPTSAEPS